MLGDHGRRSGQLRGREAGDSHVEAGRRLSASFDALRGLPDRLLLLAGTAAAMAASSRRCLSFDLRPVEHRRDIAGWKIPEELRPESTRPGEAQGWQALDRALSHLLAVLDDPALRFDAHAVAYEQLARVAGELASELAGIPRPHARTQCWFCGQTADQVDRLLAGEHASICNECVERCNEVLD